MARRIGIDATPLLVTKTGIGKYTHNLIHQLGKVDSRNDYWLYANRPLPLHPDICFTHKPEHYFRRSRIAWMHTMLPLRARQDNLDLFHFTNNGAPFAIDVPYVLTLHDASLFLYAKFHPWQRRLALRTFMPMAARRAARIITDSHQAKRELMSVLGLPESRFRVVHLAAGNHFRPITAPEHLQTVRQKYDLPPKFVLFIGTIEPRKNLERLLQAFQILKRDPTLRSYKLVLAGASGWMLDQLSARVEQLGLSDTVLQLGYVDEHDLPTLYSLSECFAFPSLHEGFGIPPLEAMACGTPVLTSIATAMEEVCGDAVQYVDPLDVSSIADGLVCLLSRPERREALRRQGLVRVKRYSWRDTAEQTAAVYREVIGGGVDESA